MTVLEKFLHSRIDQLKDRIFMIPKYVKSPGHFAGKCKDYSLSDIPKLKQEVEETKAALKGISEWRKQLKKKCS